MMSGRFGEQSGSRLAVGHRVAVALTRVARQVRFRWKGLTSGEACGLPSDDRGRLAPFPERGRAGGWGV